MSVIGKQIKKYRTEKGLTQEQLGELVGVTTQAVSKWERGSTPDAELLPALADVLNVSVDALFGRQEQSLSASISKQICLSPVEQAYKLAFRICWAIEIGLVQDAAALEDFLGRFTEPDNIPMDKESYSAKIMHDTGMASVRLSPDLHYFFMMEEPKSGLREQLSDPEKLRRVFQILSDKKLLRIICCMYSRLNTPIDTSLLSKMTGFSTEEVDRCMEILCNNDLAACNTVSTADGEIRAYTYRMEFYVIPLLCFADDIARNNSRDFIFRISRSKPLL